MLSRTGEILKHRCPALELRLRWSALQAFRAARDAGASRDAAIDALVQAASGETTNVMSKILARGSSNAARWARSHTPFATCLAPTESSRCFDATERIVAPVFRGVIPTGLTELGQTGPNDWTSSSLNREAPRPRGDRIPLDRETTVPVDDARPIAAAVSLKHGRPITAEQRAAERAFRSQPSPDRVAPSFYPLAPRSWEEAGLDRVSVEQLILRHLLAIRSATGKGLADRVCIDLTLVQEALDSLKEQKCVAYRGTTIVGDFVIELTEEGQHQAVASRTLTAYVGPAPILVGTLRRGQPVPVPGLPLAGRRGPRTSIRRPADR